jgi:hypothetical protein
VERTAKGLKQPIQEVLVKILQAGLPSLAKVPPEFQPELETLEILSDEELWKVAQSTVPAIQQDRLNDLLQKNQAEGLSQAEQDELDQLHTEANRVMLRKSYAYVLLKWRGYPVHGLARNE